MLTSIIESPKNIQIKNADEPRIGDEEVLVRLNGTGVCVSNLPVWQGREWFSYPFEPGAPGHEGYGTVEQTGNKVQHLSKGDHVSLISYHAYAEYDKAHESNVVKLPDTFNGHPFPGEPAACAVNIANRSDVQKGQTVVVIGTGFIGCLLIQLLKDKADKIIAVSRRPTSLNYAETAGADVVIPFDDVRKVAKQISKVAPNGIQRVIEATGVQTSLDLATEIISEYGKLVIAGFHQDGLRKVNLQIWNWKGIDVINAHERDPAVYMQGLNEAIALVNDGVLQLQPFITNQYELKEMNKAFQDMNDRPEGYLKGIINYQ